MEQQLRQAMRRLQAIERRDQRRRATSGAALVVRPHPLTSPRPAAPAAPPEVSRCSSRAPRSSPMLRSLPPHRVGSASRRTSR